MTYTHISVAVDTAEPDHFFYMFPMEKRTRFFYLKKCEKLQILEIIEVTLYPERYLFLYYYYILL